MSPQGVRRPAPETEALEKAHRVNLIYEAKDGEFTEKEVDPAANLVVYTMVFSVRERLEAQDDNRTGKCAVCEGLHFERSGIGSCVTTGHFPLHRRLS